MLVGRKDEIKTLKKLYKSTRSEFVALYGRRRVGKTYLIKELFENQFTFQVTGLSQDTFTITKSYASNLRNKISTFRQETATKKTIFLTFITTFGVTPNQYTMSLVQNGLTLDDLFG